MLQLDGVDPLGDRVAAFVGQLVLDALDDHRYSGEGPVVSTMVEMQVGVVNDHHHVLSADCPFGQGVVDRVVAGRKQLVDRVVTLSHSGVDQDRTVPVPDDETKDGTLLPASGVAHREGHLGQEDRIDHGTTISLRLSS
jgi:hypothetical protein